MSELVQDKPKPNYTTAVLDPLYAAQKQEALVYAAEQAAAAKQAEIAAQAAIVEVPIDSPVIKTSAIAPVSTGVDGLVGSLGYSDPDGNCVDEPGVNNPGYGNPISWAVLYYTPHIGSTVLFTFNHTAVVVGIWSNGDVEVDQENAPGMTHRIPPSMVRGYR